MCVCVHPFSLSRAITHTHTEMFPLASLLHRSFTSSRDDGAHVAGCVSGVSVRPPAVISPRFTMENPPTELRWRMGQSPPLDAQLEVLLVNQTGRAHSSTFSSLCLFFSLVCRHSSARLCLYDPTVSSARLLMADPALVCWFNCRPLSSRPPPTPLPLSIN